MSVTKTQWCVANDVARANLDGNDILCCSRDLKITPKLCDKPTSAAQHRTKYIQTGFTLY